LIEIEFIYILIFRSIKSFEQLREDIFSKIADTLDVVSYADGEYIVRQGAKGDTFYIVAKGKNLIVLWKNVIYIEKDEHKLLKRNQNGIQLFMFDI